MDAASWGAIACAGRGDALLPEVSSMQSEKLRSAADRKASALFCAGPPTTSGALEPKLSAFNCRSSS